jgi:hypothetical protein
MSARGHRLVVARLLAGEAVAADRAAEERDALMRTAARIAWVRRTIDLWSDATKAADAAWMKLVEPYADCDEEDLPDLPRPPEQAEVDRLWRLLEEVRRHDRWPRHLHWTM